MFLMNSKQKVGQKKKSRIQGKIQSDLMVLGKQMLMNKC